MTMTWWQLIALAGFLTVMMYRFKEALWTIVTVVSWFALGAYTIAYPPGSVTAGNFVHQVMIYTTFGVGVSCGAWFFFSERKRKGDENIDQANPYSNRGIADDADMANYRKAVRTALRRKD